VTDNGGELVTAACATPEEIKVVLERILSGSFTPLPSKREMLARIVVTGLPL